MAAIPAHNGAMTQQIRAFWKWLAEPLAVIVLMFCATTAIAQPFYIPSGSMEPTLRIGDAMIASKYAYGYSAWLQRRLTACDAGTTNRCTSAGPPSQPRRCGDLPS